MIDQRLAQPSPTVRPTDNAPRMRAKLIDLAGAAPQLVLYAASIIGLILRLEAQALALHRSPQPTLYVQMLLPLSNGLYLSLLMVLLILRPPPVGSASGVSPKLAALVGFSLTGLLVLLPPARMSLPVSLLSLVLTLGGTVASISIATVLGRCFSIFPQARALVTRGPYRFIRHPLYLAEFFTVIGISLQFAQPGSILVALAAIAAQFPRMHYEEQILSTTYPKYRAYMTRTARLIPGVY
jgi:protein-S-isoprenylcysteine O-methyltransferase Ste14